MNVLASQQQGHSEWIVQIQAGFELSNNACSTQWVFTGHSGVHPESKDMLYRLIGHNKGRCTCRSD